MTVTSSLWGRYQLKTVTDVPFFHSLSHSLSSMQFASRLPEEDQESIKIKIVSQFFCGSSKMLRRSPVRTDGCGPLH